GISLKPAANMHQMKGDMTGAAVVLSVLAFAAQEKVPTHVVGILACAENMPDGGAVKPADVVRAMNGDTIEIINTDAEGRLVLCDALTYAQKQYAPKAIIDIATLTGACAVALGDDLAGLFSTDDSLANLIQTSGGVTGEHFWRMPLWQPYTEKLKSEIADICHTGPRNGGAINAALFLQHFVENVPWAHLDIAGVDWKEKKTTLCPIGATAFGTRTLLELVRGGLA
ncbi:MAG: leucyl aminopeptidase family protein, partial [Desulfovibrio sp.]|nr:leucyl aminopeptidase family protein [Desulfovibrio sp.]